MFHFLEDFDIANCAEDSTPYCASKSAEFVVSNLEQPSMILFQQLNNNYIKGNTGKSYLLLSGNSRATATIDNSRNESEDEQELLGITIDFNITFENYIKSICKKASQILNSHYNNRSLHEYKEAKNNHEVFCKILNNKDLKIDPCGTPNNISLQELYLSFIFTPCFLFERQLCINFEELMPKPYAKKQS